MRPRPPKKLSSMIQPAALTDKVDGRLHRSPGRYQVVEHDHLLARGDRILLDLDGVAPVFEVVSKTHGPAGQLPFLANHRKTATELVGEWCGNEKPAGFYTDQQ